MRRKIRMQGSATAPSGSWPHHRSSGSRRVRVGVCAIVLADHCSIRPFGNIEIRRGAFGLAIPAKIPAKRTAAVGFCLYFQCVATIVPRNPESNQRLKLLLLFIFFLWCPWPAIAYSRNHLNLRSFYPSIAADTSRNTSKMTRGTSSQK
jgi:hypothetical protein